MIGLRTGDRVVVHSSLRAVGMDADELIDELLDTVGPEGLLVMPTFRTTTRRSAPTCRVAGALTEVFRRRSEALRSDHPTYSVAAIGADAAEVLDGHARAGATGVDSPLGRLAAAGGLVLLLGVGHTANTSVHVGEFAAGAHIPFDPDWPTHGADRFPGCSRAFGALERPLRDAARSVTAGSARRSPSSCPARP